MPEEKIYEKVMTASRSWASKECLLCGQHFKEGQQIVLIVPPFEYKKEFKRLQNNAVAHLDEWLLFKSENGNTMHNVITALGKTKKPKKEELTAEQILFITQFKDAARHYGFWENAKTKSGVKVKKSGSSDTLEYNVYQDTIRHSCRRQRGMFDGLAYNQLTTNVWNKMHEIRGDGKRDNYSAVDIVNKAVNTANDMMGKKH